MNMKFDHSKFTALCVLLNSEGGMSVHEYDEYEAILFNARNRLIWLAEQKGCKSCVFFEHGCTKAEGRMPPEAVQKKGCEVYNSRHEIPY